MHFCVVRILCAFSIWIDDCFLFTHQPPFIAYGISIRFCNRQSSTYCIKSDFCNPIPVFYFIQPAERIIRHFNSLPICVYDFFYLSVASISKVYRITITISLRCHISIFVILVTFYITQWISYTLDLTHYIPYKVCILTLFPVCTGTKSLYKTIHRVILIKSLVAQGIRYLHQVSIWRIIIRGFVAFFIYNRSKISYCIISKFPYSFYLIYYFYKSIQSIIFK